MSDGLTVKEYLSALKNNRLLGMKCRDCGYITAPPRHSCRKCGCSGSEIVDLTGKGKIVSFTSVYVPVESRRGRTPYCVVMVELEEGPWIMGNLSGVDPAGLNIDLIGKNVEMNMPPSDELDSKDGIAPQFCLID